METQNHNYNITTLINEIKEIRSSGALTPQSNSRKNEIINLIGTLGVKVLKDLKNEIDKIISSSQLQNYSLALDLCESIGKIGGEESFQFLAKVLNTESKFVEFDTVICGAVLGLKHLGDKRSIEYLIKAKSKNHQSFVINNINAALETFGISNIVPKDILSKVQMLRNPKEAITILSKYQEIVHDWDNDMKRYYYSLLAVNIKNAFNLEMALPYYAASLVSDPDPNTIGWDYFKGEIKSKENAIILSKKYPLRVNIPS